MSKNIIFAISALFFSTWLFTTPKLFAAGEELQQLSSQERAEEHRKRKPDIAQRKAIRAALKALRSNGALQRSSRQRTNNRANTRRNSRLAAQAALSTNTNAATESEEVVAIKHVLLCETEIFCQTAHDWAVTNNFNSNGILTSEGHGGETMYHLFLRQDVSPDEDTIASESSRVHEGVETLEGIRYATWMLDLDPEGNNDNGGNQ